MYDQAQICDRLEIHMHVNDFSTAESNSFGVIEQCRSDRHGPELSFGWHIEREHSDFGQTGVARP